MGREYRGRDGEGVRRGDGEEVKGVHGEGVKEETESKRVKS